MATHPVGIFYADKGLEFGLSVPFFRYFRSQNNLMCHYCDLPCHPRVFHILYTENLRPKMDPEVQ